MMLNVIKFCFPCKLFRLRKVTSDLRTLLFCDAIAWNFNDMYVHGQNTIYFFLRVGEEDDYAQ